MIGFMDGQSPASERKLRLDQFLKHEGLVPTGGQAKLCIQAGEVRVNGEVELRRGRGLRPGDRIEFRGRVWTVEEGLWR
jgi:ribosome-associated protein